MKTERVLLTQVNVNAANPRTITERKLNLLVERLLAFPKMIEIRPVVVDDTMTALGGNMRLRAFNAISKMTIEAIATRLSSTKNYQRLSKAEQKNLLARWQEWLLQPSVEIVKASSLSEAEKKEFVIADNASFGEWDYDKLANEWDSEELVSWGVDVWNPESMVFGDSSTSAGSSQTVGGGTNDNGKSFDGSGLPQELSGVDVNPDELPKLEGDNEVAMERVIIVYPKDREEELALRLGLERIDKVVYNIDEVVKI